MTKKIQLATSILFSILIHILFFYFIFNQSKLERLYASLWSGGGIGGKDHITFVELAKIDITDKENPTPPQPDLNSDAKNALKKKIQPQKNPTTSKKSQSGTADKTIVQKASGTGNSDTPNDGNGEGLDPGDTKQLASNLAKIRKKIMRNKVYPKEAKDKGLAGTVKLAFKINTDGSLTAARILQSSGVSVLDASALSSLNKSVPLPYYPDTIAITLEYMLIE